MALHKVLLIEDVAETRLTVQRALLPESHVVAVGSLEEGKKSLVDTVFDLVLLDVLLPDGNGVTFCASAKEGGLLQDIPVIFLTSKTDIDDKVAGFSVGGEDYLVKPFHPSELRVRVMSALKRKVKANEKADILNLGDVRLHLTQMQASRIAADSSEILLDLTPMEFKLLTYFVKSRGKVIERQQLLDSLWANKMEIIDRTIDTHLSKLRKKLADSSLLIESVYGVGYRVLLREQGS